MITQAEIVASPAAPDIFNLPAQPRGLADYPLRARDLIAFGQSPCRWVKTPPSELPTRVELLHLVRSLHLSPATAAPKYARRPETYEAMRLTCPKCKSAGPAKVCTKCGQTRRNVVETRPWSSAAKHCLDWVHQAEKQGLRVVPTGDWDAAAHIVEMLMDDANIAELREQSDPLVAIQGIWTDTETGVKIPVRSLVDYAPRPGGTLDNTLASLTLTRDASPNRWAGVAYALGHHIHAALLHALYAAATGEPRPVHLWAIAERDQPHLTARRRGSAELMLAGNQTLERLLNAYAKCLRADVWPSFDLIGQGSLSAWSEVFLEPWMTESDGRAQSFFAVSAAAAANP